MACYLGVDMGTSSMKATLVDSSGTILWHAQRAIHLTSPDEGLYEIDSEREWWQNFLSICGELRSAGFSQSVRSLCVSSVCASFVPVDENLLPLHNAVLYGIDRRSAAIAAELNEKYGQEFLYKSLGSVFSTQSVLPKIVWFKQVRPDIYARTKLFIPSYGAVASRLTGAAAWDYPTAFGAGLLRMDTLDYPEWFLHDEGIDRTLLPPVHSGLSVLAPLTSEAAKVTGLPEGISVMTGTGDINAEAASAGAIDAGTCIAALGSTVSMLLHSEQPMRLNGFMPGMSLKPGVWRLGVASTSGGLFLNRMRGLFGEAEVPSRPTGIFVFPYQDGARTPFNNPGARGGIYGIDSTHTTRDIAGAAFETIAYDIALILSHAGRAFPVPEELHLTGGLAHNRALVQLLADVLNKTLCVFTSCDASYGSALIARYGAEKTFLVPQPDSVATPNPARVALYEPYVQDYIRLCQQLYSV